MILLKEYDEEYPSLFKKEIERLNISQSKNFIKAEHIGSTAITGMVGKGIIDILLIVKNINEKIEINGYKESFPLDIPFHKYFSNDNFHIHVLEKNDPHIDRFLNFRDYLNNHAKEREEYIILKKNLAQQAKDRFNDYTLKKYSFINNIIQKSGFDGLIFSKLIAKEEKEIFDNIKNNNFQSNYENEEQFVLYKGAKIVSIASITFKHNEKPYINYILNKNEKNDYSNCMNKIIQNFFKYRNKQRP